MRSKIVGSIGIVFAASLLISTLGAKRPLIDSIAGPALFKAYCAVCHGSGGAGDGPMALALKVPPADLTRIAERNGGAFPMARVERIIAGEEPLAAGHGTREMPVWGPIFSRVDRDQDLGRVRVDNLTRYLMSIQTRAAASAR